MSMLDLSARTSPLTLYYYTMGGNWTDTLGNWGEFNGSVDLIRLG